MGRKAAKTTGDNGGKIVETVTKTREVMAETDEELHLEADPADEADDDAMAKLDEMEPGNGARYEVRRTSPAGYDGYVGTYSREELSPDRIFEEWGGGRFTIRVRNTKGAFLGSAPLAIAGKPKHKGDGQPAPQVQQQPQQQQDTGTKEMIGMLTTLVKSLIERPAPAIPPPPPAPDLLAILASAKQLFKADSGGGGGIDVLLKGIELGKSLSGDGEEPGMASVFLKGFDSIKELAKASPAAQQRPAQRPRIAQPPGSVAAGDTAAAPPPPPPPKTDEEKQLVWIKAQCVALANQAAKGKDPELYAEVFVDNLPPFAPAALVLETMKDPAALEKLSFLVPAVGTHREWFEKFMSHVIDFIEEAMDEEADYPEPQPMEMQPPPEEFPSDDSGSVGG